MQQQETPYVRPMPKFELWEPALVVKEDGGYVINRIVIVTGIFYSQKSFDQPLPKRPVWSYFVGFSERDDLHIDFLHEEDLQKFPPFSQPDDNDLDDE